jgi:uncharacterized membrane protein SpoIIM required for sporulation
MSGLEVYLILALATGLTSCIYLVSPGLKKSKENLSPFWMYSVVLVLATILAPLFALFILVPKYRETFIDSIAGKL